MNDRWPGGEWPTLDRPPATQFELWKEHVDLRLDKQDKKQDEHSKVLLEIRDYLAFGRIGVRLFLALCGIGAAVVTILSFWRK